MWQPFSVLVDRKKYREKRKKNETRAKGFKTLEKGSGR